MPRCGLVYRWDSPRELATAVETLVGNQTLADEMGNAGMEAFSKEYSWSQEERTIERDSERITVSFNFLQAVSNYHRRQSAGFVVTHSAT